MDKRLFSLSDQALADGTSLCAPLRRSCPTNLDKVRPTARHVDNGRVVPEPSTGLSGAKKIFVAPICGSADTVGKAAAGTVGAAIAAHAAVTALARARQKAGDSATEKQGEN